MFCLHHPPDEIQADGMSLKKQINLWHYLLLFLFREMTYTIYLLEPFLYKEKIVPKIKRDV